MDSLIQAGSASVSRLGGLWNGLKKAPRLAVAGVVLAAFSAQGVAADDTYLRSAIGAVFLSQPLAEAKAAMLKTNSDYVIDEIRSNEGGIILGLTGVQQVDGEMADGMLVVIKQDKVASINRHQRFAPAEALSGAELTQAMLEQYGTTPSHADGAAFRVMHWEYDQAGELADGWGVVCSKNEAVYEMADAVFGYPYGASENCSVTVTVMARAEGGTSEELAYNWVAVRVSDVTAF